MSAAREKQRVRDACATRRVSAALCSIAAAALALAAHPASTSFGGSYEIDAQVIGAGATTLTGAGGLTSDVVVGQDNAAPLSGANGSAAYGGFWNVAVRGGASDRVFQSGFETATP